MSTRPPALSETLAVGQASPAESLRQRAIHGSAWTIAGYGAGQVLRFGSNLLLTRLLAPDVFGLMTLVNVIIQGLNMFSDIGIGPSIMQHPRGEDEHFLNTAWTLQVVRGLMLGGLCAALAAPAAWVYREPLLLAVLPVTGLNPALLGFSSTALHLANKRLRLARLTLLDLATQALTVAVTIALAAAWHNVWALVVGGLLGSAVKLAGSHLFFGGSWPRLTVDRSVMRDLVHFGRWVTVSTVLTFLINSGDRMVLGRVLSKAELGVYAIGFLIPQTLILLLQMISTRVIFPLCVQLGRHGPERVRSRLRTLKLAVMAALLPPLWLMTIFSQTLVDLLYDPRYRGAGWILRLFASTTVIPVVTLSVGAVLLAQGDSYRVMLQNLARFVGVVALAIVGYLAGGATGLIVAFAAAPLANYPLMAWYAHRTGTWYPELDLAALAGSALVLPLAWRLGW